jgi:hypothetical protein
MKMPLAVEEITIVEFVPLAAAPMAGRLLADRWDHTVLALPLWGSTILGS